MRVARAVAVSLLLAATLVAPPASAQTAGIGLAIGVTTPVTVGDQNQPGVLDIRNISAPAIGPVTLTQITLTPGCGDPTSFTGCSQPDPGAVVLDPVASGIGGACAGINFNVTGPSGPTGQFVFTPIGPPNIVLGTAGTVTDGCIIQFTYDVLRVPTLDADAVQAGVQTRFFATASGQATNNPNLSGSASFSQIVTVLRATPGLTTNASPPPDGTITPGTAVTDVATVTGVPGGPVPTGTVNFALFGPGDPTCAATPAFTNTNVPLVGGTATSAPFAPVSPGVYNFTATYSGDANYNAINVPVGCGVAAERFTVAQLPATVDTVASTQTATPGATVSDTATVTGQPGFPTPTGTVTFTLYGPFAVAPGPGAVCAAPVVGTSPPVPLVNGVATSPGFVVAAAGTYNFTATYSGDTLYAPAGPVGCGVPAEQFVLNLFPPTVATQASITSGPPGGPVTDTATVSGPPGSPTPTGSVVFSLVGPFAVPPTPASGCAGPLVPVSPSAPVLLVNGVATSPTYNPTLPGTYNFIATYSGDANFAASGPIGCGVPAEQFTVALANPNLVTQVSNPTPVVGSPITDTATLSNGNAPTGTIRFFVYGPDDATCAGPATELLPPATVAGNGNYVSAPFTPTAIGSYRFIARYSGDALNAPRDTLCNDPNETAAVSAATIEIVTVANPSIVTLGQPVTDTATISNGVNPTGTLVFRVFGPDDATCTAPPAFVSPPVPVAGNGNYVSPPFTPTLPGVYRFTVAYSGDVNNFAVSTACNDPNENFTATPLPTINVVKTADPLTRPEPGGNFTYTVLVTNTSGQVLTITSLTDSVYGDLTTRPGSTCSSAIGTVLAAGPGPGNTYTCSFSAPFMGNAGASLTDVVTVVGVNPQGVTVTDDDDAVVTLTPVPPAVDIVKTADPLTRPEPGGDFTYTVVVTNTSTVEPLTITSLTDNIYGNLATRANSTCGPAIGTVLAVSPGPGNTFTCTFTAPFTGNAGASLTDVATVTGVDDDGQTATDFDDAVVSLTGVPPLVQVDKTADPLTRPEPGGDFTYTVVVTNTSTVEALTITSLTDSVYGNLATRANSTCGPAIGTVLAISPGPGNTFTCTFTAPFTGNAGDTLTDVVTVTGVDDDGQTATDTDDAIVAITNVVPQVLVQKTASPDSRPEPGGNFTYTVVVFNNGPEAITITSLTDNVYGNLVTRANSTCGTAIGTVLATGGSYTCTFTAPFMGNAGASLTDVVTVTAVDDDGTTVTDDDDAVVRITPIPPLVLVDKTANPLSRPEPGGDFTYTVVVTNTSTVEALTITSLNDSVYGNLATRANSTCGPAIGRVLAVSPGPGNTFTCTFTAPFIGNAGASLTDVVTVVGVDDDGQTATDDDDAVVRLTDVPPTITAVKTPTPGSLPEPGGTFRFDFRVTNTSNENVTVISLVDDVYGDLNGRGTCAVGAVLAPGASYSCFFEGSFFGDSGAAQTDTITVTARDDDGTTVTARPQATVRITDVPPTVLVDKTAAPDSRPEPGGTFTFKVVVTNTSFERVQITNLVDDVYGDLNGRGTCAVGAILAPNGGTYTCAFDGEFRGPGGSAQTDVVTVRVVDNEGTPATDSDDARVTITPPPLPVGRPPQVLVRTGSNSGGPLQLATGLVVLGLLMLGASRLRPNGSGLLPAGGPGPSGGGPDRGPGGGSRPSGGGGWFGPAPTGQATSAMTALVAGIGMARNAFAPVAPPMVQVDRVIPPPSAAPDLTGGGTAGGPAPRPTGKPSPASGAAGKASAAGARRARRMTGLMMVGAVVAGALQGSGKRNLRRRRRRMPW